MDQTGFRFDGHRSAARLAQPARSACSAGQEFPPDVAGAMMSRDHVLHKVRTALGRNVGQPIPDPPSVRLTIPEVDMETRVASFCTRLEALAGTTYQATSQRDACAYVENLIDGKPAVASNAPVLHDCGITALPNVRSGITDRQELRDLCASVRYGITGADYALADTGSLVMLSSPVEARMISLLPPAHIAI